MLSINNHPDIRELFKDFRITQPELAYTVGRDKTGKTSGLKQKRRSRRFCYLLLSDMVQKLP